MQNKETAVDLSGLSDQDISAIESEAHRRGLSFDETCKQILRERSQELQKRGRLNPIARLFRFQVVH
jgi:predicted DNA binding CopG/RHH family protein